MSRQARDWVRENLLGCTSTEKLIALLIADYAHERHGHSCSVAVERIAHEACCSVRTVQAALFALSDPDECQERGMTPVLHIERGAGRGNHNVYSFPQVVRNGAAHCTISETEMVQPKTEKVQSGATKGAEYDNLSIYEPILTNDEPDDDLASQLRWDLEEIVQRPATSGELKIIAEQCASSDGRRHLEEALRRLKVDWAKGKIIKRHDCSGWLETTLDGIEEDERKALSRYARPNERRVAAESAQPSRKTEIRSEIAEFLNERKALASPLSPHEELWKKTLGELQLQLASSTYYTWLHNTWIEGYEDGYLIVGTANTYARDWLDNRLKGIVRRTLKNINKEFTEVQFVCSHAQSGMH